MLNEYQKRVLEELQTSLDGLSTEEVDKRIKKDGFNQLKEKKSKSIFQMFLEQLKDKMIIILLIASLLSFLLKENVEGIVILIIVFINAFISVWEEKKATMALLTLKNFYPAKAKVIRNGKNLVVLAKYLVKGDIVLIEAGDIIPADLILLEENSLKVDESSLTGESIAVEKNAKFYVSNELPLAEQKNKVFSSTIVTYGTGMGVVIKTGENTEVGQIAKILQNEEMLDSPLKRKLNKVGTVLSVIGIVISILIFIIGLINGENIIAILMVSISLAISVIPEGLPATATIIMALGVERMAKKNALVKTLPAVEALGSARVICTDKTGTLTENKMTVTNYYLAEDLIKEKPVMQINEELVKAMTLCNNATISEEKVIGDPTEGALLLFLKNKKITWEKIIEKMPRIFEKPFDSDRKRMSVINKFQENYFLYTKGAIEEILDCSSKMKIGKDIVKLTDEFKEIIKNNVYFLAKEGVRLLGFAYQKITSLPKSELDDVEKDLIFLGVIGMIDPPKNGVKESIKICHEAGIKVVMITGDHKLTATKIASDIGIYKKEDLVINGDELAKMSDSELDEIVDKITVYARVSPKDKLRIVKSLQNKGEIVAMTGDGVNDSPALKKADIGVSMGTGGTDVAKESSNMILLDNNFSTVPIAIKEGRRVYHNIEKVIQFLLAGNIAEVLVIFLAIILNVEAPLLAVHILFINLVTDTFPSLALGIDEDDINSMQKKASKNKNFLTKEIIFNIVFFGLYISIITLIAYKIGFKTNYKTALTMSFLVLSLSQIFHSFNMHSNKISLFSKKSPRNIYLFIASIISIILLLIVVFIPAIRNFFSLANITFSMWLIVITFSLTPIFISEMVKYVKKSIIKD